MTITSALISSPSAHAACIEAPDKEILELQTLVGSDPNQVLARAQAALQVQTLPANRAAWLHAVRAQAFTVLELDNDARAAAAQGLKFVSDPREPVNFELVSLDAENIYDAAGILQAIGRVQAAAARLAPDARVTTCTLITVGTLQYRHDDSDLAISTLVQAYDAATHLELRKQRVLAADALSSVMREVGDYRQALTLNAEVIEWYRNLDARLALSVALYLRGNILLDLRDFSAASHAFEDSRALSIQLGDTLGVAFADMRLCEVQVGLRQFMPARLNCSHALSTFTAKQAQDMIKQTRSLLAELDLQEGRAQQALSALDDILADGAVNLQPRLVASVYKIRARANAELKHFAAAYADLNAYTAKYVAATETRRAREIAGLRARFETDREIERSARLQRELEASQQRQRELRRLTWGAVTAGVLVIGLLGVMLANTRRHRRQLALLANSDGLTRLPNRRRTADLANESIARAAASGVPLTLALIDLDHFKIINDELGHAAGDQVLRDFASLSSEAIRANDTLGRWGGEEFLLIMPDTTPDLALRVVERLRARALDIALPSGGRELKVSLSAGLACTGSNLHSLDELVAFADAALYRAKEEGRNRIRLNARNVDPTTSGIRRALARP